MKTRLQAKLNMPTKNSNLPAQTAANLDQRLKELEDRIDSLSNNINANNLSIKEIQNKFVKQKTVRFSVPESTIMFIDIADFSHTTIVDILGLVSEDTPYKESTDILPELSRQTFFTRCQQDKSEAPDLGVKDLPKNSAEYLAQFAEELDDIPVEYLCQFGFEEISADSKSSKKLKVS